MLITVRQGKGKNDRYVFNNLRSSSLEGRGRHSTSKNLSVVTSPGIV